MRRQLRLEQSNYIFLLFFLLLIVVGFPIVENWHYSAELFNLFFTGVLVTSAYTVRHRRREMRIAIILGVFTLASSWLEPFFSDVMPLVYFSLSTNIVFLFFIITVHIREIVNQKSVNVNLLYASLCVYILIGLLMGFVYILMFYVNPAAFLVHGQAMTATPLLHKIDQQQLFYYSFVTLTTLGYGDISPASPLAQDLAIFEVITGQFYLTILVARLVALYIRKK